MAASHPRYLLLLNDVLRLADNPLLSAIGDAPFVAVVITDTRQFSAARASLRRRALQQALLLDCQQRFARAGLPLLLRRGVPATVIAQLCQQYQLNTVLASEPTGPDEYQLAQRLPAAVALRYIDCNSLLADALRPDLTRLPRSFTAFRQAMEPALPVCPPQDALVIPKQSLLCQQAALSSSDATDPALAAFSLTHSAAVAALFPPGFGSVAALAEPAACQQFLQYLPDGARHYKQSRNALAGADFASYLSAPLALGTLSVRWVWQQISDYEQTHGSTDSSYWLKFELLWREYFRHLLRRHQRAFFARQGLGRHRVQAPTTTQSATLLRWQQGQTGEPLVDANMRLLQQTGWLSNRARQNVASYLHFELGCDWRLGAAWFEQQLLDYDVASNWGNWAYIVGALDSAPRRFNLARQTAQYDPELRQCQQILQALAGSPESALC